ncbi:hypothetical protein B0A54_15794 [Friedmanniomyces endolithicus]|uniref:Glycosyltransferase 2-like domain-containing protein n=1 Tax=Friedmanniomyces endolithicus TaxID=329885 RepID=A0A4U0U6P8_9PEZI|nr:hypothetical protein B0A54_15794 [Friedmanniomyces endolithicus]
MPAEAKVWLAAFIALFVFRYLRTVVPIFTFNLYRPKRIRDKARYTSSDVTVVVPTTFKSETELMHCLRCIFACSPAEVLIVCSIANVPLIKQICSLKGFKQVEVLGVKKLNKRTQMIKALKEVETEIVVFADDDVFWPGPQYIDYLLAVFEDEKTGAGGTRQRARRNPGFFTNVYNFLGISYLERRVWNNISTNAIDGSLSTLSGRTAAYLTAILQNEELYEWLERQNDDDKCLTRYVYSHGWNITIQSDPNAVLEKTTPKSYWCSSRYWWGMYVIYVGQFQSPALLIDGLLFGLLGGAMKGSDDTRFAFICLGAWIFFTKIVKLIPHFLRYPQDMMYIPVSIAFSYLHGFINIYALATQSNTHWGSQKIESLQPARAQNEEVVPLLRNAISEGEVFGAEMPGRMMMGRDYFSVSELAHLIEAVAWAWGWAHWGEHSM